MERGLHRYALTGFNWNYSSKGGNEARGTRKFEQASLDVFSDNEEIITVLVDRLQHKAYIVVSCSVDRSNELIKEAVEENYLLPGDFRRPSPHQGEVRTTWFYYKV